MENSSNLLLIQQNLFKSLESDQGIKPLYNLKPLAAVLQFAKVIHFIAAEQVSKGF